jgi:hypothetical protein
MSDFHFYEPKDGHRLPHDPFKAIVAPRPIGWISSVDSGGRVILAPYSFFNAFCESPPIIGFSSSGRKDRQLTGSPPAPSPRRCRRGLFDDRVGDRAELIAGERGKPAADSWRVEELVEDVPLGHADAGPVADHGVDVVAGLFVVRHGRLLSDTQLRGSYAAAETRKSGAA